MRRRRSGQSRALIAAAAVLPALAGALTFGAPSAQAADPAPGGRVALQGTQPAWATGPADLGSAARQATVTARVHLAGRDPQGLTAFATAVSDPHSPLYGQYLTADQARSRFGATEGQKAAVAAWLRSAGLTVTATNDHYIEVTGTVAAAEQAFATPLHSFRKDGRTYRAPVRNATAPASVAAAVLTVSGLDDAPHRASHKDTLPRPGQGFRNSGPFSSYYGSRTATSLPSAYGRKVPYAIKGYTGRQLRAAYGAGRYTGKGVTVAITDAYASPTIAKDARTYAARNGDAPYRTGGLRQVTPAKYTHVKDCDAAGWYGEETLDVEAVHAVAPEAKIVYVAGASCNDPDLLDALDKVVDKHLADIVSNSWGDVEANQTPALAAAYDHTFKMGTAEGIGFYFSSGDDGDEVANTGKKQVDTPANSSWVTAVGGTSLAVGKGDTYKFETGWGTKKAALSADGTSWTGFPGAFTSGAGGGTSTTVAQPFYQRGIVPDALAKANGTKRMRTVPDVAAVADPNTGFLVGQTQSWAGGKLAYGEYRIGGTSLAAPVIAGIQALAQQALQKPIGFANPGFYSRVNSRWPMLHDVTDHPLGAQGLAVARVDFVNGVDASGGLATSVRSLGKDSSLHAVRGYDLVTGVGSPGPYYVASHSRR
ncbi:protease pro-enzyme activation domain-containing protein [Streptomyces sp. NRRL S-87]|uniref:S53 family peptidase n=1 Tax=Streptomyces sp. NRRL S-87 TaxID=1463920 RepID=UPI0004C277FF|nr:S53 family peptidase [Streptomyces sp. NRRL S-87]